MGLRYIKSGFRKARTILSLITDCIYRSYKLWTSHFLHPYKLWSHKISYFASEESKGINMGQDPIRSVLDISLLLTQCWETQTSDHGLYGFSILVMACRFHPVLPLVARTLKRNGERETICGQTLKNNSSIWVCLAHGLSSLQLSLIPIWAKDWWSLYYCSFSTYGKIWQLLFTLLSHILLGFLWDAVVYQSFNTFIAPGKHW